MKSSSDPLLGTGILALHSKEETKQYFKKVADCYQAEVDQLANTLGDVLRTKQPERGQESASPKEPRQEKRDEGTDGKGQKKMSTGWFRLGAILVNSSDSANARTEMLFQLLKEYKLKLAWSTDALKAFDEQAATALPDAGEYTIFVKNGLPERIVIASEQKKAVAFVYAARFRVT